MDPINTQLLLALTCVAAAVAVLLRRFVRMIRNPTGSGCHSGGCGGCPSKTAVKTEGFIALDELVKSPDKRKQM